MKRVALGGLHTECSSYSPLEQVQSDFTRLEGQALIDRVPYDFKANDIEAMPIFHDRSVPGGPVSPDTFKAQCDEFFERLKSLLPLDGVLLLMHGALFVRGVDDPEGAFIKEVRNVVGPTCVISAAFDLHGQVTQKICDHLDAFAAYRTAPHIDVLQTYGRAMAMLGNALNGGTRPHVRWQPIQILASGEMSSTFVAPCDRLYEALPKLDARPHILDCNLMIGYVWADSPRATAAAVVTATDAAAGDEIASEIADSYINARDELVFDMETLVLSEALIAVQNERAILADSGDNPTAGGVGDRADVLDCVLRLGLGSVLFAGIADPGAYDALEKGAAKITIGGSLGGGGPKLSIDVDACRFSNECAIATIGTITLVISKKRRPFHNFSDFEALELSLDDYDLLVVKSGYLSPDIRTLPRRQIMALTDGAVCQNFSQLANKHRPSGTWPFSLYD